MDISIKHLNMIKFALERWIDNLEERIDDLKSEEMLAVHNAELAEFESLHCMIDQLLLKQ